MHNNYHRYSYPSPVYFPNHQNYLHQQNQIHNLNNYQPHFYPQNTNDQNIRIGFPQFTANSSLVGYKDYGPNPYVVDIEKVTKENNNYRTTLWTGTHLQVTLMSIDVGEDIGLENHPNLDQFIRIEEGEGLVTMGDSKNNLNFREKVYKDFAFIIPAGKWHNLINTGYEPIKLYSIYAPPEHLPGTVHQTKEIAMASERHHNH